MKISIQPNTGPEWEGPASEFVEMFREFIRLGEPDEPISSEKDLRKFLETFEAQDSTPLDEQSPETIEFLAKIVGVLAACGECIGSCKGHSQVKIQP